MLVDKNSQVHLYVQIADSIRQKIVSGEYPVGSIVPTEVDLCQVYGVSRYPMRQAMSILVKEGYLNRTRGKGTFVNDPAQPQVPEANICRENPSIALVMTNLNSDFAVDILRGFEKTASENGYSTVIAVSGDAESELACLKRLARSGVAGIVIFPIDDTLIDETLLNGLIAAGIYVSIIDRNPGLDHIDYVGSDNNGGGYLAARHMKTQGYNSAVFVSDTFVSSVFERFSGFARGAQQFGIRLLSGQDSLFLDNFEEEMIGVQSFSERLGLYRQALPFAVFAENDITAASVLSVLQDKGLSAGEDVGVIGFDNSTQCDYLSPALTSIAQNGSLIGETAVSLAIQKIDSGSKQSVRHILPTQLMVRKSCGEGRNR
jgi:GntR family transcriptional regulator, arabinose operon transcriptional repressor